MNIEDHRNILKERYISAWGKGNKNIEKMNRRNNTSATIFLTIPTIIISVFVFLAFIIAIVLTFYSGRLSPSFDDLKFVGFKNWGFLFNESRDIFITSIKNTLIYTSIVTSVNILGALILATILNSRFVKRKNLFMTIYFFPQITSSIAVAVIFLRITGPGTIFNLDIIRNAKDGFWVMVISSIWGGISGSLIIFNSAFTTIGRSQYEAASLDGAKSLTQFFKITIPSLAPIVSYSLITGLIGGMGVFDQAYVLEFSGADTSSVMTWALLGYARIIGLGGDGAQFAPNVGLGMVTLTFLGLAIFVLTRIANIFQPIERKL